MIVVTTTEVKDEKGNVFPLPPEKNFGKWLKLQAHKKEMSYGEIGEKCGVSKQAVSLWARELSKPSLEKLALLAGLFNEPVKPAKSKKKRRAPVPSQRKVTTEARPHAG